MEEIHGKSLSCFKTSKLLTPPILPCCPNITSHKMSFQKSPQCSLAMEKNNKKKRFFPSYPRGWSTWTPPSSVSPPPLFVDMKPWESQKNPQIHPLPGDSSRDLLILQLKVTNNPLKGSLNHPKKVTAWITRYRIPPWTPQKFTSFKRRKRFVSLRPRCPPNRGGTLGNNGWPGPRMKPENGKRNDATVGLCEFCWAFICWCNGSLFLDHFFEPEIFGKVRVFFWYT